MILAEITVHRGHSRTCPCGHTTRACIPGDIFPHCIGPHLTATAIDFAGSHGVSKCGIEEIIESLFGVLIALGTISNLEREAMAALVALGSSDRHRDGVLDSPARNIEALTLLFGKLAGIW